MIISALTILSAFILKYLYSNSEKLDDTQNIETGKLSQSFFGSVFFNLKSIAPLSLLYLKNNDYSWAPTILLLFLIFGGLIYYYGKCTGQSKRRRARR